MSNDMSGDMSDDHDSSGEDGYDGPAELVADGQVHPVAIEVSLRGHFDPISGSYRWYLDASRPATRSRGWWPPAPARSSCAPRTAR